MTEDEREKVVEGNGLHAHEERRGARDSLLMASVMLMMT